MGSLLGGLAGFAVAILLIWGVSWFWHKVTRDSINGMLDTALTLLGLALITLGIMMLVVL